MTLDNILYDTTLERNRESLKYVPTPTFTTNDLSAILLSFTEFLSLIDLQKTYGAINRRLYDYLPRTHCTTNAFRDYVASGNFYPTERLGRNKSRWTASAEGAPFAEMVVYMWHDFFDLMYLNELSPILTPND